LSTDPPGVKPAGKVARFMGISTMLPLYFTKVLESIFSEWYFPDFFSYLATLLKKLISKIHLLIK
jgi:hypothetical protein